MSLESQDSLRLRKGARIAAYRRPGVVALLYVYRAVAGLIIALPLSLAVSRVVGKTPRGDAELFDPGGMMLLETLRLIEPSAMPLGFQAAVSVVLVGFFGLVPLAMILESLSMEGRLRWGTLVQRAFRRLGTLSLLFGIAVAAEAGATALFVTIGDKTLDRVAWSDSRHRDIAHVILWTAGLSIFILVGIIHDLSRVMVVRKHIGLYGGVACALRIFRRRALAVLFAYGWRGALALTALGAAIWAAPQIGQESKGELVLLTLMSQAAILVMVYLRVDWLAAAMRIGDRVYDKEKAAWEQLTTAAEPARESMLDLSAHSSEEPPKFPTDPLPSADTNEPASETPDANDGEPRP